MEKLLVCTDGSHDSEVCYAYAAWLAKRTHALIDVLYVSDLRQFEMSMVTDFSGSLGVQPFQGVFSQLQDIEKEKTKLIGSRVHKVFKKYGIEEDRVKFHQRTGFLTDCFEEFSEDTEGFDVICLGKRGENARIATEHLGSTMERVIRSATKPCLVTPRKFHDIQRVLIAYDGSPSVNRAIQFLTRSEMFKEMEFHLITCSNEEDRGSNVLLLKKAVDSLESAGYKIQSHLMIGEPGDVIEKYVVDKDVHLLIMGAYGHGVIRHLIIGSTTTDLIRRCHVPILLFK
ncbi:MAG: hypothetical protein A2007_05095 [Verrucomicrobia bacterium GWC2_42_7]|nr:MAG: hypothetical protein A2007_05095 [Verrucomicrobia bacterium GWC2_42_7]